MSSDSVSSQRVPLLCIFHRHHTSPVRHIYKSVQRNESRLERRTAPPAFASLTFSFPLHLAAATVCGLFPTKTHSPSCQSGQRRN